jgi:hypothetical protein
MGTRVKEPGCEADHSPSSSAGVKNAWSHNSTPPALIHGVVLSKAQEQLYLLFIRVSMAQSKIAGRNLFSAARWVA